MCLRGSKGTGIDSRNKSTWALSTVLDFCQSTIVFTFTASVRMAPSAPTTTTTTTIAAVKPAAGGALNFQLDTNKGEAPKDLHVIPTFADKYAEREWAKNHMAAAFRTSARLGWADGASGHISLRDPLDPELFWISKS